MSEAFQSAVKHTETIEIQQELYTQAVENHSQAVGALFPTLSGSVIFARQHSNSIVGTTDNTGTNPVVATTTTPGNTRTVRLTADQPLFRGLRDFAELRRRKDLVGAQKATLLDSARQLFYLIANSYYNLLQLQSDERNYLNEIEINKKHVSELQGYVKIGRSAKTDLLTFQVNSSSLDASLVSTRGQIEAAKDVLAYVTGWDRNTLILDNEPESKNPESGQLDHYLGKIEQRPDFQIAQANLNATEEALPIARGGHLPNVDAIGNYYFDRPGGTDRNSDWDVQLAISIPIFQGGVVQSQVRQAASQIRQSQLTLSQTRRMAEQEIRNFYTALQADAGVENALEGTATLAKTNYETELHDYRQGLVNNLEVLTAVTNYQVTQRQLDRQKLAVKLDFAKLQAATAERPEILIEARE